jgi:hypothetical protein
VVSHCAKCALLLRTASPACANRMHPARAKQQPRRSLVKAKPQPSHSRASIMPQACQRVPLALKPVAEAVELLRRVYAAAAEPSYTCANHACAAVSPPALRLMAANRRAAEATAKPQPSHSQATAKPQPCHSHASHARAATSQGGARCLYLSCARRLRSIPRGLYLGRAGRPRGRAGSVTGEPRLSPVLPPFLFLS